MQSLSEQALHLIDIAPCVSKRRRLDNFANLDPEIGVSISSGVLAAPEAPPAPPAAPYSVAARLDRPQYEEQAKAEALMNALRQMRSKHGAKSSPRVIRGT